MKNENTSFFDGFLVGFVIVGIIIALYVSYRVINSQTPLPSTIPLAVKNKAFIASKKVDSVGQNLLIQNQSYIIIQEIHSSSTDEIIRVLINDTSENNAKLPIDRPICLADNQDQFNYQGSMALSLWDKNGERLLYYKTLEDTRPDEIFGKMDISCLEVLSWYDDGQMIISNGEERWIYDFRSDTFTFVQDIIL